ncbi:MAG TPA: DICT sensory domain-containing protein, partial [Candidatus Obscuribacterales bacterium]
MDVSLYQLALDTKPSSQPLSVSPATIKSLVAALVDVLIEQQLPATLWVKLPPGEIWQAEIDRYRQQVELPHTLYLCRTEQTPISSSLSESTDISRIFPIQLAPESQLRREYFLLVLSAQFCGVILTHRPRLFKTVPATNLNTKPQLLTIYSFVRQTVQRVLDGIKKAMPTAIIPPDASAQLGISGGVEELIARWDSLFALPQKPDPLILNQLLLKQLQRQEEMWHQVRLNKRLADSPISVAIAENLLLTQLSGGTDAATSTDILKSSVGIKDEFLNHMVQELRMPLTNMKTALTLLESASLKPAQRQRYMHLLHTECDRQSSLIAGLLDLLQLENATSSVMQPLYLA